MNNIDYTKVKPVLKPKDPKVKDPIRYPKLIVPLESKSKKEFANQMNKAMVDITRTMVEITKPE